MQNIRQQKSWYQYVPWMAISSLILVTVGMILWAVGTTRALSDTDTVLRQFHVEADQVLGLVHDGATGAVVVCMLMAVIMVLMALGRTSLEKKIDQQGRAQCGTWLWLAISALFASIWWIVMFWMVFVIFGSCIWYGAAFTVEGSLGYVLSIQGALVNVTNTSTVITSSGAYKGGSNTTLSCPSNCFNMAYFSYYTKVQDACVCNNSTLRTAWNAADSAATNLHLTVAGSFIMWVGCSFMLMVSVSGFASTKRERELLLRAQRNAAEAAGASMSLGPANNGYPMQQAPAGYKDTQPLLQPPQHSAIQMAPQQMMGSVTMQRQV